MRPVLLSDTVHTDSFTAYNNNNSNGLNLHFGKTTVKLLKNLILKNSGQGVYLHIYVFQNITKKEL